MKNIQIHDPLYGFISLSEGVLQQLLAHPYLQRLRRITQLGLIELVYPSATHTRFQHSLGTLYLMGRVLSHLQQQGIVITREEHEAALAAALLHDIGHGPFSHVLERNLLPDSHEDLGLRLLGILEIDLQIDLSLTKQMLEGAYPRSFLSDLLKGTLDVDRMDYLHRDSFFTGVAEGQINIARLIEVLQVQENQLQIAPKGAPTVEDFFHARRMMYLQVYRHKTVLAAGIMLQEALGRARYLIEAGKRLPCPVPLQQILSPQSSPEAKLWAFTELQDAELWVSLQYWKKTEDKVLSMLSQGLLQRQLWTVDISETDFSHDFIANLEKKAQKKLHLHPKEISHIIGKRKICTNTVEKASISRSTLKSTGLATSTDILYYVYYPKALIH